MAIYNNERDPNEVMWEKQNQMEAKFVINREPSFNEVWYEGFVEFEDQRHYFWLIDPQGHDAKEREYEMEVRWFFKRVPMEVRNLYPKIIEAFKKDAHDNRKNQD